MNEADLVRALLPEHQGPTASATKNAHAKLSAEIARSRRRLDRPWWARRKIAGPVLAAVAAAAVAIAILVWPPAKPPGHGPAAVVLLADHAVAATATQPAIPDRQWLYQKVVAKSPDGTISTGVSWIQSGTGELATKGTGAGFTSGFRIPNQDFARLPGEPRALISYLVALTGSGQGYEGAFLAIGGTFINEVPPPAVAAKLYRALGDFPGVTINRDAVDVAGRHGVAFARGGEEIILSQGSYRFMGFVTDGPGRHQILDGEAILQRAPVPGPFVLP